MPGGRHSGVGARRRDVVRNPGRRGRVGGRRDGFLARAQRRRGGDRGGAGETARVEFDVPMSDLRYWDEDAKAWLLEETDYVVEAGPSSRELPLRAELKVRLG